ncbi:MAG: hypothetical protein RIQ46_222, partial [Pseudomonadota bacterium]
RGMGKLDKAWEFNPGQKSFPSTHLPVTA